MSDPQRELLRRIDGEGQRRCLGIRPLRLLTDTHTARPPVHFRWNEQVDPQTVVIVEIDALVVFDVVLHAAPDATGETVVLRLVFLVMPRLEGKVIDHTPIRMLAGPHVVQPGPLVKVRHPGVGVPAKHVPG